ncbi:MAG: helix-turn-helix transcriptional regulator [bacterium]
MHTLERGTRIHPAPSADLTRDATTLDRLGVPFAVFNLAGYRLRRSAAAVDLLAATVDEWERIAERVRSLTWLSTEASRDRQATSVAGAVYSISRLGDDCAIVVFHPAAPPDGTDEACWAPLTVRERQVANCIAHGRTSREVAACLGISVHTARRHTESVYTKLGVRRRTDVARIALAVTPDPALQR